jgi:hypothetical protein
MKQIYFAALVDGRAHVYQRGLDPVWETAPVSFDEVPAQDQIERCLKRRDSQRAQRRAAAALSLRAAFASSTASAARTTLPISPIFKVLPRTRGRGFAR